MVKIQKLPVIVPIAQCLNRNGERFPCGVEVISHHFCFVYHCVAGIYKERMTPTVANHVQSSSAQWKGLPWYHCHGWVGIKDHLSIWWKRCKLMKSSPVSYSRHRSNHSCKLSKQDCIKTFWQFPTASWAQNQCHCSFGNIKDALHHFHRAHHHTTTTKEKTINNANYRRNKSDRSHTPMGTRLNRRCLADEPAVTTDGVLHSQPTNQYS